MSPKEDIYDDNEYAFLDEWITNRFTALLEEMEGEVMKGTIVNGSADDSYVHAQGLLDALTIIKKFKEGLK